ncbi:MAG: ABC transporter substrate-binding protein [Defluviitaleaceae bacterium]|nr:ABC transporter substrate-binding protein [Defluviitaleaceae bacterium]
MKKLGVLICTIALMIFLTACDRFLPSPPASAQEEEEYSPQEPDPQPIQRTHAPAGISDDGVLRLAMRHPLTLNPLLNEDYTVAKILDLIFEPLIIFDYELRPVGHLALIEMASDFSSGTLTIRSDAIWSDGMPVTTDDLIFSVEVLRLAPDAAIYKSNVENIASITRVDSKTAIVNFVRASATAGYALNFPIIPEHYYRGHNNMASPRNLEPLGNGPFLFESMSPMLSMTLAVSPYSFRRRAAIDEIEVLFIPDATSRLYAFDQGIVDAIRLPFSEWVKHHSVKPVHHEEIPAMYFEFIGFNFQRELFQDIEIRRGIAHAFDADEAMSAMYSHQAVTSVSPIHPNSWMHDDRISRLPRDIGAALQRLVVITLEEPIVILVNEENIERIHIAERLALELNLVQALRSDFPNVRFEVVVLPFEEYYERLMYGDFDMFLGGMELSLVPDFGFMFQGGELFGYHPELEDLLASLDAALTETAFLQAVSQLQQAFVDQVPLISLGFRHSAVLTGTRVVQERVPPTDSIFVFVNEWEIE